MRYNSKIVSGGEVKFPPFMAEKVYMREFRKQDGLPTYLSRWQDTVDAMLEGVETDGPIYIMIDSAPVLAASTHRRKGIHIDGYWNPAIQVHQQSHIPFPSGHGGHRGRSHCSGSSSWAESDFSEPEGLILASNVSACVGYTGQFEGTIGDGGDCSHIDLSTLNSFQMDANRVYLGNVTCLHESIPVKEDCLRQLVRLNVPGWTV